MSPVTNSIFNATRNTLHKWLSLSTGIIILFFCLLNSFMLEQRILGGFQVVLAALNFYFFWVSYHNQSKAWHRHVFIITLCCTAILAFAFADLRAGSIYWLILLPAIFCLLGGAKAGLCYTILASFPAIFIIYYRSDTDSFIQYRSILNFVLAYFMIYGVCYLYELQQTQNNQLLAKMAFEDPLTGAKNRHALKLFFDHFNRETQNLYIDTEWATRLLVVDIDFFKTVNDECGHEVGDQVLIELSELLQFYADKDNVYRIGGEEFLIILKDASATQAYDFAENIRARVEHSVFRASQHQIKITVSIGIAKLQQGHSFRKFLKAADKNLYSAKHKGRNLVHHSDLADEIN
ncbi:GGDEF domain-containing protein [Marinomonas sp. TW1]|uniref:GGDEF domain-containing protein n=1 Tax=Marinomonas sp. TW1 TaxID=1561203 RepID=UPI0007AF4A87|nr:GGDEF domain-containing protein [Marinomonas sp. TW1]KZN14223.1 diguanylate cyclase [Marinomonas sp. TW1]